MGGTEAGGAVTVTWDRPLGALNAATIGDADCMSKNFVTEINLNDPENDLSTTNNVNNGNCPLTLFID